MVEACVVVARFFVILRNGRLQATPQGFLDGNLIQRWHAEGGGGREGINEVKRWGGINEVKRRGGVGGGGGGGECWTPACAA
jgi:hypothetical protein